MAAVGHRLHQAATLVPASWARARRVPHPAAAGCRGRARTAGIRISVLLLGADRHLQAEQADIDPAGAVHHRADNASSMIA